MTRFHLAESTDGSFRGLRGSEGRRRDPTNGRQGKRPAFGAAYVVGWTGQFTDSTDTPCWRFSRFLQGNQCSKRRRTAEREGFRP
jgi:hypothetical protein